MSRQSKMRGKQLTRNAEGGPQDRHLERQSRKRLCKYCGTTRISHDSDGKCQTGQTYGEVPVRFEASLASVRISRRAKATLRALGR